MKRHLISLILVLTFVFAKAQVVDNQLLDELGHRSDDENIEVIVVMKARYDRDVLSQKAASVATRAERRTFVVNELKAFAKNSQKDLMDYLDGDAKSLWASNSLCFSATKAQIMGIAKRNDVEIIGLSKEYNLISETGSCKDAIPRNSGREITPNITQTNVPDVWAQGYTGAGVIVAVIDSGVNYDHQDIADHLWDGGDEFPHHGYDYVNGDDDPMDDMGHGTHCAGTVCGDGTAGSQTGVAIKSLDFETVNGYKNMDGTSQTTPLVGGIIALMLQKNPNLMPADICRILEETSSFTVYPNPAGDIVNVVCESEKIELMDIHGQRMEIRVKDNQIDVSNLQNGIYFIKIGNDIVKMIINR